MATCLHTRLTVRSLLFATVMLVVLAGTRVSNAQQVAPALELGAGVDAHVAGGADASAVHLRGAVGVQVGRYAALLVGETMTMTPGDPALDSPTLESRGYGFAVRAELLALPQRFAQLQAGVVWRDLTGAEEVTRTCGEFGGCVAGYYQEVPAYQDAGIFVAGTIGLRTGGPIWAGAGLQLGVAHVAIDRPGTGPDARGVLVWASLTALLGGR